MSVRCITGSDGSPSYLRVNAITIMRYSVYGSVHKDTNREEIYFCNQLRHWLVSRTQSKEQMTPKVCSPDMGCISRKKG